MANVRQEIVGWAKWGVVNHNKFTYSEGSDRMHSIGTKAGTLPITCDCSAFVTLCYFWAGAPDPNGLGYDHEGYTGTLLAHGIKIPLEQVLPGDVIVYGPDTGWHTALVIESGSDPLTVSMGKQGDPSLVRVSQDGRLPQTYLRFSTIKPNPVKKVVLAPLKAIQKHLPASKVVQPFKKA